MNGQVDERNRALLDVLVSNGQDGSFTAVTTWIDTAFDGQLVFSQSLINELELEPLAETEAILADGSAVVLQTYYCEIEWFGRRLRLHVIANEGRFPLLGTGLLEHCVLHVDYVGKQLTLESA